MIKLIAFDVDGTLFSSEAILGRAYKEAVAEFNSLRHTNFAIPDTDKVLSLVGNTGKQIFKVLFPEMVKEDYPLFGNTVRKRLIEDIHFGRGKLYDGVMETLHKLKARGFELRMASNGHKDYVNAIASFYSMRSLFGPIIAVDNIDIFDKADILNTLKSAREIHSNEMVMVGDRKADLLAAQSCGCKFIGISYGHGDLDEITSSDSIIIHDFKKLLEIIDILNINQ